MNRFFLAVALAGNLLLPPLANAGDDHDHDAPSLSAAQPALPRLAISGEQFELVGELSSTQLTLYIDWRATTAPAAGAKLQLQLNGQPLSVAEAAPGTFVANLPESLTHGHDDEQPDGHEHEYPQEVSLVATIALEQAHEQLAGHFDRPADDHAEAEHVHYERWLAAAAALLLAGLALFTWRRRAHGGGR